MMPAAQQFGQPIAVEGEVLEQHAENDTDEPCELSSVDLSADEDNDSNLAEERELYTSKAQMKNEDQDQIMKESGFYNVQ